MHQKPSGGPARTRWGSLSAPSDPLAVFGGRGPREGRGRKGKGWKVGRGGKGGGREKGWEGKGGVGWVGPPLVKS